jgi:cytochrome c oxidase subunit 4
MSHAKVSVKTYALILAVLLVLTLVTAAVSYVDLGVFNLLVAVAIAVLKGFLVVLFFMHVKASSRLVWVFAGAGFYWFILLLGGTLGDTLTRAWTFYPGR